MNESHCSPEEFEELLAKFEKQFKQVESRLDAISDKVELEFRDFFLHVPEEIDPFAYGLTQVSARRKSVESLKRNYRWATTEETPGLLTIKDGGCYSLGTLRKFAEDGDKFTPSQWCHTFRDLLGVRLIARSQRGKYQVYRAIEYLCDIHATDRQHLTGLVIPSIAAKQGQPDDLWKYYNPPAMRAYYSPYVVDRYHREISEIGAKTSAGKKKKDAAKGKSESTEPATNGSAPGNIRFLMKDSGYATLQRNVELYFGRIGYRLEIQIRTALEHCWAEPEHAMTYKGVQDRDPVTEEVKAMFRSYGLSLVAADDALQMALDKHRLQNDHEADFSDRTLKPFKISEKAAARNRTFAHDLSQIYDYVRLGFIGDAIVLTERTKAKFKNDLKIACILKVEEAICHLHNLTLLGDSTTTVRSLTEVREQAQEYIENPASVDRNFWIARRFWATFRLGHAHLLIAEYKYTQHRRDDGRTRVSAKTADYVIADIVAAHSMLQEASASLALADVERALSDDVEGSQSIAAELKLLLGRCWRWLADLAPSMNPEHLKGWLSDSRPAGLVGFAKMAEDRFGPDEPVWTSAAQNAADRSEVQRFQMACLGMSSQDADDALKIVGNLQHSLSATSRFDIREYNDVDLAAINSALWLRRRMHFITQQSCLYEESKVLMHELIAACSIDDKRRSNLLGALNHIRKGCRLDEQFEDRLSKCRIFELKILDTVIGFKSMENAIEPEAHECHRGEDPTAELCDDYVPSSDLRRFLSDANSMLTQALVRVAARGDFAFDSHFAFGLLSRSRLG